MSYSHSGNLWADAEVVVGLKELTEKLIKVSCSIERANQIADQINYQTGKVCLKDDAKSQACHVSVAVQLDLMT